MPTVTVACKLPNGLILRVFDMVDRDEPVMGGGMRKVKVAQERPAQVTIKGNAHPQNAAPRAPIIGGFALTQGVDKEFWDLWLAQNKDSDVVRNRLIFAHENTAKTEDAARAKDNAKNRSGFERLNPHALPKGIEPGSEDMKKIQVPEEA